MNTRLKALAGNRWVRLSGIVVLVILAYWFGSRSGAPEPSHDHEPGASEETTVWTCSMHPQVQLPKPGKCPICFMDLIPLQPDDDGGDGGDAVRLSMSENAKRLAAIATAPVVRRGLSADIRMTGKIALDETLVEMIAARVGGRIDRLYVDYVGVPVKAGDHLARIYSPELVSLQRELIEASRAVAALSPDVSSMVRTGTERTFDAAREKLRLLGFSTRELKRVLDRGEASDHMTIRAGQRGVVLKKMVEEGSYVKTGMPMFHVADLRKLWVMLDAYESDLLWLRLGQTVDFTVEAYPGQQFTGSISFIEPVVDPRTRTVSVRVIVDNPDGRLKPDMFVKAHVKASVAKSGGVKNASLRGKWISPMHPQVIKDNPGTCDICGMPLVRAEELGYVTSGLEDIDPLVAPAAAVLFTGRRSLVYVEVPGADKPTYEARVVELGPRVGGYQIVKSGVAAGEQVVVNGAFKIDGELQIRAKPSMMSPARTHEHEGHLSGDGPLPEVTTKDVSAGFQRRLDTLRAAYFDLAGELTTDDVEGAKKALVSLRTLLAATKAPRGEAYEAWRTLSRELASSMEHAHHVAGLSDARGMFEKVSRRMIALEKHYGHQGKDTPHYLAFCPMAFDNKGAYWLQTSKEIQNPYFGKKMLTCGEIKETFTGN